MTALDEATEVYYRSVATIADYLLARGITGTMAQRFRLGYVADPQPGHESYAGRLAIPYLTPAGVRTIRFRRVTEDDSPKYLGIAGQDVHLFNAGSLLTGGPVALAAEGELDALVLSEVFGLPAVGVPGSQSWKPWWGRCFAGFSRVLVFTDGDSAGADLGKRFATEVPGTVILRMPDGADVSDVHMSEGAAGLRRRAGL